MHPYSKRRASYENNVNVHAAEVLVCKKPVLSSSSARTLFQSALILDASIVPLVV